MTKLTTPCHIQSSLEPRIKGVADAPPDDSMLLDDSLRETMSYSLDLVYDAAMTGSLSKKLERDGWNPDEFHEAVLSWCEPGGRWGGGLREVPRQTWSSVQSGFPGPFIACCCPRAQECSNLGGQKQS